MTTRVCPQCRGTGLVPSEPFDTVRMSQEDVQAMVVNAIRTPQPPPPEDERVTLASDTWMIKRIRRLRRSYVITMFAMAGILGLLVGYVVVLLLR